MASAYVFKGTNVLEAAEARNSSRFVAMKECRSLLLAQGSEVELPPPPPFALSTASGPFSGIFPCSLPTVTCPTLVKYWGVSFSDCLISFRIIFFHLLTFARPGFLSSFNSLCLCLSTLFFLPNTELRPDRAEQSRRWRGADTWSHEPPEGRAEPSYLLQGRSLLGARPCAGDVGRRWQITQRSGTTNPACKSAGTAPPWQREGRKL